VLVDTLVLTLVDVSALVVVVVVVVVVVGSVVVVVVASVVVGVTVSVTVCGAWLVVAAAERDVVVSGVNVVDSVGESPPAISLANPKMINATTSAPTAPNATSAAGLRYHGTGSSETGGR
jgi:hypothetical protein